MECALYHRATPAPPDRSQDGLNWMGVPEQGAVHSDTMGDRDE
jgi:hypothetical protein